MWRPRRRWPRTVRLAYHILEMDEDSAFDFADAIVQAKKVIGYCPICQNISDGDVCPICADENRQNIICVVEDTKAVSAIEQIKEFRGYYHVLHGVISPIDGIGPDKLKIKELLSRINENTEEIIIATNPSVEGEATAMYISRLLRPIGIKVTRLAYGVPVGSQLEYADEVTLSRALEGRQEI